MNSVAEIQTFINAALTSKYENDSITIQTMDVAIKHIGKLDFLKTNKKRKMCSGLATCIYSLSVPENCLEETTSTIYGQYIWPEAFPQVNQDMGCKKPESERAYRLW